MDTLITLRKNIFVAAFIAFVLLVVIFIPFLAQKVEKAKIRRLNSLVTSLRTLSTSERPAAFAKFVKDNAPILTTSQSSAANERYCVFIAAEINNLANPTFNQYDDIEVLRQSLNILKIEQGCK